MAALMERLTRAGWVRKSFVAPDLIHADWTEAGKKRAMALGDLMDELDFPMSDGELMCLRFLIDYHSRRPWTTSD